jgi:tetratricopeptide (TPR) repeat protein
MVRRNSLWISISLAILSTLPSAAKRIPPESYAARGDECLNQGRFVDAIDQYSRALKSDKHNPSYLIGRAKAELGASKFKQALSDGDRIVKFVPADVFGYEIRASANDFLKEYKHEYTDLDKLVSMTPGNSAYLLQRARVGIEIKRMKQVIDDCNAAITMNLGRDDLAQLYQMRATAYKKLGKKAESQQEMSKYESLR